MKHRPSEAKRRMVMFKAFVAANPPKLPAAARNSERKRILSYARIAFITGYNTGENDVCKGRV